MLEDEVIDVLASEARKRGHMVLAEGGNQMRAFRFTAIDGRRKAPDLVIFGESVIICFEAKVRGADLLRGYRNGASDLDVQASAAGSPQIKSALILEGIRRLAAAGKPGSIISCIEFGVISESVNEMVSLRALEAGLCYVATTVANGRWQAPIKTPGFSALFPEA